MWEDCRYLLLFLECWSFGCECFYEGALLASNIVQILQQHQLVEIDSLRRYLLEKVTHVIGGFGKAPGEIPGEYLRPLNSRRSSEKHDTLTSGKTYCIPISALPHWHYTMSPA